MKANPGKKPPKEHEHAVVGPREKHSAGLLLFRLREREPTAY